MQTDVTKWEPQWRCLDGDAKGGSLDIHQLREVADRVRPIPLERVLLLAGAEKVRSDKAKWRTEGGTLSVNGAKFMDWHRGVGGGGAIDLVMHLYDLPFKPAVEWLAKAAGLSACMDVTKSSAGRGGELRLPPEDVGAFRRVRSYLVRQRGLPSWMIERLFASGALYADNRGNAVFLLFGEGRRPVGAELRGTWGSRWRGMALGSRKDLGYFSAPSPSLPPTAIVLCESAIDALSCSVFHSDRLCISTSGARANPAWLPSLLRAGYRISCGFDTDETGEEMAHAMIALHPAVRRIWPALHDWNDVLRGLP